MAKQHQPRARRAAPQPSQKIAISIRLKPETLAAYRATGKGWQTRISAVLDSHVDIAETLRSLTAMRKAAAKAGLNA